MEVLSHPLAQHKWLLLMNGVVLWFGGLAFDGRRWQNVQLFGIGGMFLYTGVSCHLSTLSFGSLMCLALSDGRFQRKVLLLQEVLDSIVVDESFDNLVAYILLCALV